MSTDQPSPPAEPKEPQAAPPASQLPLEEHRRIWQSNDLLGDDAEALIVHRGQTYRLRCTKQGKLILYK
ncbi:hemin uptake protein HemP [Anatilimnocola sp. NA78]|uniref:hemin uptake protein HemP n=1 Tax=Anatilimnocola sp. NA78 TaxID=3415683 RepID=UPI003CE45CB8